MGVLIVYQLGNCLKDRHNGQPYRIIEIKNKSNHKAVWKLYTVQHVFKKTVHTLRVRELKRLFKTDDTAQILYGIGIREAKVLYAEVQKQTKSLRKLLAIGSLYGACSGRWSTAIKQEDLYGKFDFIFNNKNSSN